MACWWSSLRVVGRIVGGTALLMRGTCHSHDCGSCHPQKMISPFASMSTPCYWKMMVHPASHSSLTVSRLCFRFLRRNALHFIGENLAKWRHIAVSVCMVALLGIVRQKFGSWQLATLAGAPCCARNVDAAESIKSVVIKFFRSAQLGLGFSMVLNKLITGLRSSPYWSAPWSHLGFPILVPAGSTQSIVSGGFALVPLAFLLQVLLLCSHSTFYPWVQQYPLGSQSFWGLLGCLVSVANASINLLSQKISTIAIHNATANLLTVSVFCTVHWQGYPRRRRSHQWPLVWAQLHWPQIQCHQQ